MRLARLAAVVAAVAFAVAATAGVRAQPGPVARAEWTVSTSSPEAQAAFDRGLAMLYAFSCGEARIAFAKAAAADPQLAMAWWGTALSDTIDINSPRTDEGDKRGAAAIGEARKRLRNATAAERALVDALAQRFAGRGSSDDRFRAYADAMHRFAQAHPSDANALTLAAYARWNATKALLHGDGTPSTGAFEIENALDAALAIDSTNLGARHLRIHLEEDLGHPGRALGDARFLDTVTFPLGMSHLPHMAGHIYDRVGDYDAMIAANRRALANDAAYFAAGNGEGQAYMRLYHDHDLDFVLYGLTTQGRDAEAWRAVAGEDATMRAQLAVRTRHYDEAIASGTSSRFMVAVARARSGRIAEARKALTELRDTRVARPLLAGVIAWAEGDLPAAIERYRAAQTGAGADVGDPKDGWEVPIGEGLGALLLAGKRYPDAETTFRDELKRFPNDPRLAYGLGEALRAQGKDDAEARAIVTREWHGDHPLTLADLG